MAVARCRADEIDAPVRPVGAHVALGDVHHEDGFLRFLRVEHLLHHGDRRLAVVARHVVHELCRGVRVLHAGDLRIFADPQDELPSVRVRHRHQSRRQLVRVDRPLLELRMEVLPARDAPPELRQVHDPLLTRPRGTGPSASAPASAGRLGDGIAMRGSVSWLSAGSWSATGRRRESIVFPTRPAQQSPSSDSPTATIPATPESTMNPAELRTSGAGPS